MSLVVGKTKKSSKGFLSFLRKKKVGKHHDQGQEKKQNKDTKDQKRDVEQSSASSRREKKKNKKDAGASRNRVKRSCSTHSDQDSASLLAELDAFSQYSSSSSVQVPEVPWVPSPESKEITPQRHLDSLLQKRGYEAERFDCLNTAYFNAPTPLQLASYHKYLESLVKQNAVEELAEILQCGMSPNPRNTFGSSLLHTVCRRGQVDCLKVLLDNGCSVQVADEFGRTPLHDACFARTTNFAVIRSILEKDPFLINLADSRGHLALDYVPKSHYDDWMAFLDENVEEIWPVQTTYKPSPLTLQQANSRPLPDPLNALTNELAEAVACGHLRPQEAVALNTGKWDDLLDDLEDEESSSGSSCDEEVEYTPADCSWGAIREDSEENGTKTSSYDDDMDLLQELAAMKKGVAATS